MKNAVLLLLLVSSSLTQATTLGDTAASMNPGTWAELKGTGFTGETLKTEGIGPITTFANKGGWDPESRRVMYIGQPHGEAAMFLHYVDASNAWTPEGFSGVDVSHGYDLNATDSKRGKHYYRSHRAGERDKYHVYNVSTRSWGNTPRVPGNLKEPGKFIGTDYFPELDSMVLAGPGHTHLFDIASQSWSELAGQSMGRTNNFVVYNPVHKVVVFGGGKENKSLYKLDAQKRITNLKSAPFSQFRFGDKDGDFTFIADPVSGDFLAVRSDGQHYAYDVISDSWSDLGKAPVTSVKTVVVPISTYGVIMYIGYTGSGEKSKVYLYKHAKCQSCGTIDGMAPMSPTSLLAD